MGFFRRAVGIASCHQQSGEGLSPTCLPSWQRRTAGNWTSAPPRPTSIPKIAALRMRAAASGDYLHLTFRGSAVSITEVLAGRLDIAATAGPLIRGGRLRPLGVLSERRYPLPPLAPGGCSG